MSIKHSFLSLYSICFACFLLPTNAIIKSLFLLLFFCIQTILPHAINTDKMWSKSFIQFISHVCSKYAYFVALTEKVNTWLKHLIRCAKSCAVQNIPQIFHMLCHFTSHSPLHKYYSFLTFFQSLSFHFFFFVGMLLIRMHRLYKNSLSSSTKLLPTAYRMPLMLIYYFKCRW